jgi:hypothetical protein
LKGLAQIVARCRQKLGLREVGALGLVLGAAQPLVRGFELARSFSHEALQVFSCLFPVEQMTPYFILADLPPLWRTPQQARYGPGGDDGW